METSKKPQKLYKYVSLSKWDFENINNNHLYLRTASFFNDVFDSTPFYSEDVFNVILKHNVEINGMVLPDSLSSQKFSIEKKVKIYSRYYRNIWESSFKDSALISCFAEVNDSNIMWAHYGNIYEGAIFEYDTDEILEAARSHLLDLKKSGKLDYDIEILNRGPMLEKVVYTEKRSDISNDLLKAHHLFVKYREPYDYGNAKYKELQLNDDDFKAQQRAMFLTKALEWSYENEWRLIIPNYNPEKAEPFTLNGKTLTINLKPKSVILGFKIPKNKAKQIIKICIDKNINLYGSGPDYFSEKPKIIVESLHEEFVIEMLK